jgi:uncharacterized protein (TIGR03435 family)
MRALIGVLICSSTFGQAFEAASVKPVDLSKGPVNVERVNGPERFQALLPVPQLIYWAYGVRDFQISGGPAWFIRDWFAVQATAGHPSSEAEIKQMVQALLADRFKLKLHRDTKEIPVYALMVGKNGPKLTAAKDATQCNGNGCFGIGNGFTNASGATMAFTAEALTHLMDRPIIDKTGLTGHYDFRLTYDQSSTKPPIVGMPIAPTEGPSIFAAVEDLGLKLEPQKSPVEVLVIDSVERPSEN